MILSEISDIEIELFLETLRLRYGYDYRDYSRASLKRRVQNMATSLGATRVSEIIPRLLYEEELLPQAIHQISVHVSTMFRDPWVFLALREQVVPALRSFPRINIWHPGCSTGEEVYSLAILLHEEGLLERTQIYATDIDDAALRDAEEGVFPTRRMKEFSEDYRKAGGKGSLSDYYHARYEFAMIKDFLKRSIVFAHHNLVSDGVFCETQMIVCRNVLIYFNRWLQNRVLRLFRDSLCRGGVLCLGSRESLQFTEVVDDFQEILRREAIFRKLSREVE